MQYSKADIEKLFSYAKNNANKYIVKKEKIDVKSANEVVASFVFDDVSLYRIETTKVFDIFAMFELGKMEINALGAVVYGYRC